ncbi:MAG: energy-coupling factor transporter ATPase [Ruminococcaceae bacterium]|nr:energy-coupling factor transporter ATPase [Oscillospiraceae bacterium]
MGKIVLDHVSYIYNAGTPFEKKALDDVSLSIKANCITGVIGHTGSGKSTMMMLLNGLSAPTSGKILLDGYNINATLKEILPEWLKLPEYANMRKSTAKKEIKAELLKRKKTLCFRVGLVMQYPEYQLFEETVYKDIAYGPKNMGLSDEEIKERVYEAIRFSGLDQSVLQKSPFDLSGGQKRRVAIAGVIAMRPEVLVLDEPAAGLDPRGREQILEEVRNYQKATGSTVIMVSHSMEDMAEYCQNMIVLAHSELIAQGSTQEVFSNVSLLEGTGLDIPQITQLIQCLKARGMDLPDDIYTVDRAAQLLKDLYRKNKGTI